MSTTTNAWRNSVKIVWYWMPNITSNAKTKPFWGWFQDNFQNLLLYNNNLWRETVQVFDQSLVFRCDKLGNIPTCRLVMIMLTAISSYSASVSMQLLLLLVKGAVAVAPYGQCKSASVFKSHQRLIRASLPLGVPFFTRLSLCS